MFKGTREQRGWYFFDWAVSAYSTTVGAVFLGPYLTSIAEAAAKDTGGLLYPFGPSIPIAAGSFYAYMTSLSVLLQVFFLPILGAVADYTALKRRMMGIFAYISTVAVILMFFMQGTDYLFGGILYLVANLTFGASMVFYNAFLPEIATPDERDAVSSRGFAFGYLGGGLLLILNLALFLSYEQIGIDGGLAVRICLASAGVWMAIFIPITLRSLPNTAAVHDLQKGQSVVTAGFAQLAETLRNSVRYPQTLLFLGAYLLYNDGVQTVIAMSSTFGTQELGMESQTLIITILMVQFVAWFGALGFNQVARRIGALHCKKIGKGITFRWGILVLTPTSSLTHRCQALIVIPTWVLSSITSIWQIQFTSTNLKPAIFANSSSWEPQKIKVALPTTISNLGFWV